MTQHIVDGKVELNSKEFLACKLIGALKEDRKNPDNYAVPVCMRNRVIVHAANWLTKGKIVSLVYSIMMFHPESFEYNFDNLTEFCLSLEYNN